MLFGFGVLFNLIFSSTAMNSFNTLQISMFSLFRGLLGDVDVDGLTSASPIVGPLLFCLYVTVVLFVAFTILIAVSYTHLRAHETVLDLVCRLLLEKKNKKR
eukprot:TRINITY_DN19675_c0_g1_i1.p2 TRINITY_DN19675_c0_g1~~TRINITY_DN19675_c0_g1_i1.p2  ORF type:complete len:102 (-),score=37.72 TRINITY_DN19675_c0_g1_i1:79-384(-)